MAEKIPSSRSPGTKLVACSPDRADSDVAGALLSATDLAVGVAFQATRIMLRVGASGLDATVGAGRVVSSLPGANGAGRLLSTATAPLVDRGRETRSRVPSAVRTGTQRLFEAIVPAVVDALDVDLLLHRIDIDELVQRIDIDTLVQRIAVDLLVQRIDVDRLVHRIDIDELLQRVDFDSVIASIDVNRIAERIDVDAVVEQTELGTIVARSTSGFASEALDAARSQTADADTRVSRVVNRILRRNESELPIGPPLLNDETDAKRETLSSDIEPPLADAPDGESK